jgi:F0F1-type ATP synthase delta subunit
MTLDQINQILEPLTICLNLEATEIVQHILKRPFLEVLACRRLAQTLFDRSEASNLRSELFKQVDLFEELLDFKNIRQANEDVEMDDETRMDEVSALFKTTNNKYFSQWEILSFPKRLNFRPKIIASKYKLTASYCV